MGKATASPTSTKPVQVYRLRGISASVFANTVKKGEKPRTFHKVSLQRTYRDGESFKSTSSFDRDDIPVAMNVLDKAWDFILDAEAKNRSAESAHEQDEAEDAE